MDDKIMLMKICIWGMLGAFVEQGEIPALTGLDFFVKTLQCLFYGIGSFVLYTTATDWHRKNKNYNKWVKGGCLKEEMDKYEIKH